MRTMTERMGNSYLVSNLAGVSCPRLLRVPRPEQRQDKEDQLCRYYFTLSVETYENPTPSENENGEKSMKEDGSGTSTSIGDDSHSTCNKPMKPIILYKSEARRPSCWYTLDWQPLPQNMCPLGLAFVRNQWKFRLDIFRVPGTDTAGHNRAFTPDVMHLLEWAPDTHDQCNDTANDEVICCWCVNLRDHCAVLEVSAEANCSQEAVLVLDFANGDVQRFSHGHDATTCHSNAACMERDVPSVTLHNPESSSGKIKDMHEKLCARFGADPNQYEVAFMSTDKPPPIARPLSLQKVKDHVHRVLQLQERWMETMKKVKAMHHVCEQDQAKVAPIQKLRNRLASIEADVQNQKQKREYVEQIQLKKCESIEKEEKTAKVKCQALVNAIQALMQASHKVQNSKQALGGRDGCIRISNQLKSLISRRHAMVAELGGVYRLAPREVAISHKKSNPTNELDTQLEIGWSGGSGDSYKHISLREQRQTVLPEPRIGERDVQGGNTHTRTEDHAKLKLQQEQQYPSQQKRSQVEMALTLGGFMLNPAVWKHAFDPEGYQWDPNADKVASILLGFAAHLVDKLSQYLGVPLRYPVRFRGSQSVVLDNYPPAGTWNTTCHDSAGALHGSGSGSNTSMTPLSATTILVGAATTSKSTKAPNPVEYPLYCSSNKDRPRFAVAVFLLNKDVIQLLQSHGMSSFGPNQLLQNLHVILACAESGLSHGWRRPIWATT